MKLCQITHVQLYRGFQGPRRQLQVVSRIYNEGNSYETYSFPYGKENETALTLMYAM